MVIATEPDIRTVGIADLERLVFADREGYRRPYSRAPLDAVGRWLTIEAGPSSEPEVAIDGYPEPWLEIVA